MEKPPLRRCAVYTRKSTEHGLEQEYNSLDAQRDAGERYIANKLYENWTCLPERYDDGGLSGGTMERPALQKLMEDIEAGKIDVVVVYKIDRLSRSLLDFLGIIRFFDDHGVTFVSVTQDLNTATAMGRLVLNILQSFAQFEREIASERTRDKIALSKEKGLWMGGTIPLGYDAVDGALQINENEAATVRHIFERFITLGSPTALVRDLKAGGYKTKARKSRRGKDYPAKDFCKSSIYQILNNRLYIGKIEHKKKGKIYEGAHEAIVDMKIWNRAQALLDMNRTARPVRKEADDRPYLLKGILEDPGGRSMTPTYTKKKDRLYRYYASTRAIKEGYDSCQLKTVPAQALEEIVLDQVRRVFGPSDWIRHVIDNDDEAPRLKAPEAASMLQHFDLVWGELYPAEQARIVQLVLHRIVLHPKKIVLHFNPAGIAAVLHELLPDLTLDGGGAPSADEPMIMEIPVDFKKRHKRRIITAPDSSDLSDKGKNFDEALVRAIARAHAWQEMLDSKACPSIRVLAEQEGVPGSYAQKIVRLTELAPDIVAAIVSGRQPESLQLQTLTRTAFPCEWHKQREMFGFAQTAQSG